MFQIFSTKNMNACTFKQQKGNKEIQTEFSNIFSLSFLHKPKLTFEPNKIKALPRYCSIVHIIGNEHNAQQHHPIKRFI